MVAPFFALASNGDGTCLLFKDKRSKWANEDEVDVSLLLTELEVADEAVVVAEAGKGFGGAVFPTLALTGVEGSIQGCFED